jgi:hypothetical protein
LVRIDDHKNRVIYPAHATFLWGASGVTRDAQGNWNNLPLHWLGDDNKRPLSTVEILEWLLSLPEKFGDAIFCMFGFNYDVFMLLARLTHAKAFEVCKRIKFGTKQVVKGHVFCGAYAIDYLKGKRLVIKKFRDRDDPAGAYKDNKPIKSAFVKKIVIYDLYGFYQSPFLKVMKSLEKDGLATHEEVAAMELDKKRRAKFHQHRV